MNCLLFGPSCWSAIGFFCLYLLVTSNWCVGLTCDEEQERTRYRPQNHDTLVHLPYGSVNGFTIPVHNKRRYPDRRINVYLGIPYAKRPSYPGEFRFREPEKPEWNNIWDATYYRPACPQIPWYVRETVPKFGKMDEDCLYLNVFAPNLTTEKFLDPDHGPKGRVIGNPSLYPVMVFIHGGGFVAGTSQQYPGYFIAERNVVVVTINYRLNALGFLSTGNAIAAGNYGLWDQLLALQFIKNNIKYFRGDPNKITIAGHDAGAASVGIHLLSPQSDRMFHYAIMMGGSDCNGWAVRSPSSAAYYATNLAQKLGCPSNDNQRMINCLRDRSAMEIVNASVWIPLKNGEIGNPFGPVVDGPIKGNAISFLAYLPRRLRDQGRYKRFKVMAGLTVDEGAFFIPNYFGLEDGIQLTEFDNLLYEFLDERGVVNYDQARDSLKFQYTYYEEPTNITGIRNRSIDMMSDYMFGAGIDEIVKWHSRYNDTYLYVFDYRSWNDYLPPWRGVAHGQELQYLFGFPYFTRCYREMSGVYPRQDYSYGDQEISEMMITLFTNFTMHGNPTPWRHTMPLLTDIIWPEFHLYNQSHLLISNHTKVEHGFRQQEYEFWTDYFPTIMKKASQCFCDQKCNSEDSAMYKRATWSLVVANCLLILVILGMSIMMYRITRIKDY
ncbi:NLGN [Acanthosepion pharaonis]|uniref:NLGN n=1 Tax=Acanthosepion pharaonis TaxID=158019 RepID=A0A812EJ07_ACAPH|nr:NLGN [Sepia pharaonis]